MTHDHKHNRRLPRSWFSLFLHLGGWWYCVLLGLFLIFTIVAQASINRAERFDKAGIFATAEVEELWTEIKRDSDGDRRTEYHIRFVFMGPGDAPVTRSETIRSGVYHTVSAGSEINIRYLNETHMRVEYPIGENRSVGRFLFALNWGLLLVLAGLFWWLGQKTNRGIKARRDGAPETVKVTDVRRTLVRINSQYLYRLIWEDAQGHSGQSLMARPREFSDYQSGDQTIVYRRGRDVWWEGDVGPQV